MTAITISLNQIKARHPCKDGWLTILEARGGQAADFDAQFPLAEALDSNGLDDTLWALRCLPKHDSLWRKLAVHFAREALHLAEEKHRPTLQATLDVAWRYSDGQATLEELRLARDDAAAAAAAAYAAAAYANGVAAAAYAAAAAAAYAAAYAAVGAREEARARQQAKLRQILEAGEWVEDQP